MQEAYSYLAAGLDLRAQQNVELGTYLAPSCRVAWSRAAPRPSGRSSRSDSAVDTRSAYGAAGACRTAGAPWSAPDSRSVRSRGEWVVPVAGGGASRPPPGRGAAGARRRRGRRSRRRRGRSGWGAVAGDGRGVAWGSTPQPRAPHCTSSRSQCQLVCPDLPLPCPLPSPYPVLPPCPPLLLSLYRPSSPYPPFLAHPVSSPYPLPSPPLPLSHLPFHFLPLVSPLPPYPLAPSPPPLAPPPPGPPLDASVPRLGLPSPGPPSRRPPLSSSPHPSTPHSSPYHPSYSPPFSSGNLSQQNIKQYFIKFVQNYPITVQSQHLPSRYSKYIFYIINCNKDILYARQPS